MRMRRLKIVDISLIFYFYCRSYDFIKINDHAERDDINKVL